MEINTLTPAELEILQELVSQSLEGLWRCGEEESEVYRQYLTLQQKLSPQPQ